MVFITMGVTLILVMVTTPSLLMKALVRSNSSGSVFLGEGEDYIKGFGSGDFYGWKR
jgi:hypothetical protein